MGTRCSAQRWSARFWNAPQRWSAVILRPTAARCSAGFEWPALQRGAAAARKEARVGLFCSINLKKKERIWSFFYRVFQHTAVPLRCSACVFELLLQRLCFLALQRSAAAAKRCNATKPAAMKRAAQRCTLNKVPIPGFARIKNAFVRPQYGNLVCALEKLKVGYL